MDAEKKQRLEDPFGSKIVDYYATYFGLRSPVGGRRQLKLEFWTSKTESNILLYYIKFSKVGF